MKLKKRKNKGNRPHENLAVKPKNEEKIAKTGICGIAVPTSMLSKVAERTGKSQDEVGKMLNIIVSAFKLDSRNPHRGESRVTGETSILKNMSKAGANGNGRKMLKQAQTAGIVIKIKRKHKSEAAYALTTNPDSIKEPWKQVILELYRAQRRIAAEA